VVTLGDQLDCERPPRQLIFEASPLRLEEADSLFSDRALLRYA